MTTLFVMALTSGDDRWLLGFIVASAVLWVAYTKLATSR